MDITQRISLLKQSIVEHCAEGAKGAQHVIEVVNKVKEANKDLPVELDTDVEVAFKEYLFDMISAALKQGHDLTEERHLAGVRSLLDLALAACLKAGVALKAPALIIEEYLEVLPVEQLDVVWQEVEAREHDIHKLFGLWDQLKGGSAGGGSNGVRLAMLKTCNALLRRLSRVQNTAVCGRIMLYLARNWGLSEPSAVNKAGLVNTANTTIFETEDEFNANQASLAQSRKRKFEEEADEQMRQALEEAGGGGSKDGEEEEEEPLEYRLYETFWGLQGLLVDPKATVEQDGRWQRFVEQAGHVLKAFEGMSVASASDNTDDQRSSSSKRRASSSSKPTTTSSSSKKARGGASLPPSSSGAAAMAMAVDEAEEGEAGAGGSAYLGCKYLTNSRLFRLQLRDPVIRVQVLTQVLVLLNYAAIVSHDLPARRSRSTGLSDLLKHARRLIRGTAPFGSDYVHTLDTLLAREEAWLHWKMDNKCAEQIERPLAPQRPQQEVKNSPVLLEARKLLDGQHWFQAVKKEHKNGLWSGTVELSSSPMDLARIEAMVRSTAHTWDEDVRDEVLRVDDEPPEYHDCQEDLPRNNVGFAWRALRLAPRAHPEVLSSLESGSFSHLWNKVYPPPPGSTPTPTDKKQQQQASSSSSASSKQQGEEANGGAEGEGEDKDKKGGEEEEEAAPMDVDAGDDNSQAPPATATTAD